MTISPIWIFQGKDALLCLLTDKVDKAVIEEGDKLKVNTGCTKSTTTTTTTFTTAFTTITAPITTTITTTLTLTVQSSRYCSFVE